MSYDIYDFNFGKVMTNLGKGRWVDGMYEVEIYPEAEWEKSWAQQLGGKKVFHNSLAELWLGGMTYTAIGKMHGMDPKDVSYICKPLVKRYHERCDVNIEKLNKVLVCPDPEYMFMTDKRTVLQEMCALLIGGNEVKKTLEQLSNLGESK